MQSTPAIKPEGCSNFKIRQLARRISQHYDRELHCVGLRTTQYSLLSHVLKLGPVRPGILAKVMTIDASTLTRNLKPLVASGWVAVEPGSDARSSAIFITEAGRAKRGEAQRRWKAAQNGLNDLLGVDRVLALHAVIDSSLQLLVADAASRIDG